MPVDVKDYVVFGFNHSMPELFGKIDKTYEGKGFRLLSPKFLIWQKTEQGITLDMQDFRLQPEAVTVTADGYSYTPPQKLVDEYVRLTSSIIISAQLRPN